MTDKEFKRLTRSQLIDIIYELQLKEATLAEENRKLKAELEDKRIRMSEVGNIAEASLVVFNVMQAAQEAADQYLEEIRQMQSETRETCRQMQSETKDACRQALDKAREEAVAIIEQATKSRSVYDIAVESILKEYEQDER